MIHVDFGLVTKNRQNCQLVKEISSCRNQPLKKRLLSQSADRRKEPELENSEEVAHAASAVVTHDLKTDCRNGMTF